MSPKDILVSFADELEAIFGLYQDCQMGLMLVLDRFTRLAKESGVDLDAGISFGHGPPSAEGAKAHHVVTFRNILARNEPFGSNRRQLALNLVTQIYAKWDTVVRPDFAKAVSKPQSDIVSDVMGDVRIYRIALEHRSGVLHKPTVRLGFCSVGDQISLNDVQVIELNSLIFADLNKICLEHTGQSLGRAFLRKV